MQGATMAIDYLKTNWMELAQRYSRDTALAENLFADLVKRYSQPNRHYHNLPHIHAMLVKVDEHAVRLADAHALRFAVWFHDVIYKPIRKDNEEKSAAFAERTLSLLHFPADRISRVKELILRTKDHTLQLPSDDNDTRLLVDCDLMILGTDRAGYEKYCGQIRREYGIFPDILYKPGRLKVLRRILEMPSIYRTSHFQSLLEKQARDNLQAEILLLS
jgi:predicted metal-dependent HD superfamily phosphohydrolase